MLMKLVSSGLTFKDVAKQMNSELRFSEMNARQCRSRYYLGISRWKKLSAKVAFLTGPSAKPKLAEIIRLHIHYGNKWDLIKEDYLKR